LARELRQRALLGLGGDSRREPHVHESVDDPIYADDLDAPAKRGEPRGERRARRELDPLAAVALRPGVRDVVTGHLQRPLRGQQRGHADAENTSTHVLPPRPSSPASGPWPIRLVSAVTACGLSGTPGRPRSTIAMIFS